MQELVQPAVGVQALACSARSIEGDVLDDWPDKRARDVVWVYVSLFGDNYVEAISVTVSEEDGIMRIRDLEWGPTMSRWPDNAGTNAGANAQNFFGFTQGVRLLLLFRGAWLSFLVDRPPPRT